MPFVSRFPDRLLLRLALIGALAAAFGLAGCGRKGGLDPPPMAAAPAGQQQSGNAPKSEAKAPYAPHHKFPLDPLLN